MCIRDSPKTSFCVSNLHGGNDAGVHAIAPKATIKFNFRSNSQEELAKLRTNIFNAIEEACQEETAKWGQDTITWDQKLISSVPGGTQDMHAPLVETAYMGLSHLGVEPVIHRGGCTNANVAVAKGLPALCMGRAYAPDENSKNIMNHSIHEKFPITGSYKAIQQAFMVLMMAAGIDGAVSYTHLVFTFNRMEGTTSCNGVFLKVESVAAVDDLTVKMTLVDPNLDWP